MKPAYSRQDKLGERDGLITKRRCTLGTGRELSGRAREQQAAGAYR